MHPPMILHHPDLPRLFCKPENPTQFVHYSEHAHLKQLISFWSLNIDRHLPVIHQWVNMPYAFNYWQMQGAYPPFKELYETILEHRNAHSFVGYYGDQMVCQIDVYMVGVDELSLHIPEENHYCGLHLLMGPNDHPIKGLTSALIKSFLNYYFSFGEAKKIFGEPDARNEKSIALLKEAGFQFLKRVSLSYKTADLYCLNKELFCSSSSSYPSSLTGLQAPSSPHLSAKRLTSSPKGKGKKDASPS
jgi:RimJ/RimL family protein N-acetyltransferase